MKKFLLSLVLAVAAFSANAAEIELWNGEAIVNGWNNQPTFLSDAGAELKAEEAAVGDIIRIYATAPEGAEWQMQLVEGHWGPQYAVYAPTALTDEKTGEPINNVIVDLAATPYIEYTITQDFLDAAYVQKWWGGVFLINGDGNVTITKVTLIKEGDVPTWEEVGKEVSMDEFGNILSSEFNGLSDEAKVSFEYQVSGSAGFVGWGIGSVKALGDTELEVVGIPVKQDGDHNVVVKLKDMKEALNAGPDQYGRYGISFGTWDFNDGACSVTTKSVKVFEIVGFEGEGYQAPGDATSVSSAAAAAAVPVAYYNSKGQKISKLEKGINIVKMSDDTVKKIKK